MPSLQQLLPDTAEVGRQVVIGGCELTGLADRFGTPLVVVDEQHLRRRCREFRAAFPGGVSYASKAFLCLAMASLVSSEGLGIDVASGGELTVALRAGVPAKQIVFHGNNKSVSELQDGLEAGVGRFVVDSFEEISRLESLVLESGYEAPRVLVRVNPAVHVATHRHVSTGDADSKFGFRISTGDADVAANRIKVSSELVLMGFHVHVGSQLTDLTAIRLGAAAAAALATRWHVEEVSVGGGLAVAYTADDTAPTIEEWANCVTTAARSHGFTGKLMVEPGRSLVAAAAVTLYRVGTMKPVSGHCTFVSVDGGLSDNPRPAIYGSKYEVFAVRDPRLGRDLEHPMRARVVGKNCESGDTLVTQARLPSDLTPGDLLCMPVTGAYTHAMSSNYNKLPRPAVVFVRDGRAAVVVRRDTEADLYRNDVAPTELRPVSSNPLGPAPHAVIGEQSLP